jgi:hypothetical protein
MPPMPHTLSRRDTLKLFAAPQPAHTPKTTFSIRISIDLTF